MPKAIINNAINSTIQNIILKFLKMRLLQKKCYVCNIIIGEKIVNLKSQQDGFSITEISRKCKNGHIQPNEFEE